MIKKSIFVSLFVFALGISSCGGITLEETPDGYVDVLPSTSESALILQAFDWSFSQIEENIPAIAQSGFKIVQTSPVQQPKNSGVYWWSLYQPVSFSIATSSPLGTKDDLESLCETAETYGVDIICDIVFNHMATVSDTDVEPDGTPTVSPEVNTYEPDIYQHRNDASPTTATFHHNPSAAGSGAVTQVYSYGNLPDLNTANPVVQARSLSLLKECIDVGVDGFRFDAAKHIETPNDPQYSSDFWPNVLGEAKTYYNEKTGKQLFAYGEILNDVDGGRTIDLYTPYMKVTDNTYIGQIVAGSASGNAETVINANYGKNTATNNLVAWVESHDTYIDATSHSGELRTAQRWAVMASRKDLNALFLARPDDGLPVGSIGSYHFEDETIAIINHFHNRFIGYEENLSADGSVFINERFNEANGGAIIIDFAGAGTKNVELPNLKSGVYYNQLTKEAITVNKGKATLTFGSSGIVALTMSKHLNRPTIEISNRGCSFVDSLQVDLEVKNASESYYQINGGTAISFESTKSITLGDVVDENNQITLFVSASNDEFLISKTFVYTKIELVNEDLFNVVNLDSKYYTDYELYYWAWPSSGTSSWLKNYTIDSGVVLIDFSDTNYVGFLLATFPKGYKINDIHTWNNNVIKQTGDISVSDQFYNASNF